MPSQLRMRLSHPCPAQSPHQHGNGSHRSADHCSSPNISLSLSSSVHNPQHPAASAPPPQAISPPKQRARPQFKFFITKVRLNFSTFFVLGSVFAVGSIHRLHFLALHARPADYGTPRQSERWHDAPLQLRAARGLGRHPRVVHAEYPSEPSSESSRCGTCSRFWATMLGTRPVFRTPPIISDSMLHRDGWKSGDADSSNNKEGAEVEGESQCVPMAAWQTTSYPNCNTVHEIDMAGASGPGYYVLPAYGEWRRRRTIASHPIILLEQHKRILRRWPDERRKRRAKLNARGIAKEVDLEFLGQGWFRAAWEMSVEGIPMYDEEEEESFHENESVVLKTLRIEREFLAEYYELHRRDALAMERLTFSPYVLDIHGYCGQSAINELANFGIEGMSSLEKVARSFRGMEHIEPVSKIKLQLAARVATGVSHLHSVDYPDFPEIGSDGSREDADGVKERAASNATMVHYDLNPRNIAIIKRGKPKLNDFNVAEFLTWNASSGRTCGFKGRFREPWWRAPEEMQADPASLTEKIDIYALGNVLWDILTTHAPRGKMRKDLEADVRPLVARGDLPDWPSDFNKTMLVTDPALMAIEKAMMKCLRANPQDRPTAGEIAYELNEAIYNLPEGYGDKEKWKERLRREE